MKNAPAAPKFKRYLHTFYLLQPLLQFFALVLAIMILSRCSPLAPSTDKGALSSSAIGQGMPGDNPNVLSLINSDATDKTLKEVAVADMKVISDKDFDLGAQSSLAPREGDVVSEQKVSERFNRKASAGIMERLAGGDEALVIVRLTQDKIQSLLHSGSIRLPLDKDFRADAAAQRAFVSRLRKEHQALNLDAAAYAVVPKELIRDEFASADLHFKISLAYPNEQQAVLEVKVQDLQNISAQQRPLLDALFHDAKHLAIVLE